MATQSTVLRGGNVALATVMTVFFFVCSAIFIIGALKVPLLIEGPPQTIEQKAFLLFASCLASGMGIFLLGVLFRKMDMALWIIGAILIALGFAGMCHFSTLVWLATH